MTSKEALEIIIKENKQVPAIYVGCRSDLYTKLGVEFDIIREDLCVLNELKQILEPNTLCRLLGFDGYKVIEVLKTNKKIKRWLKSETLERLY